MTLKRLSWPKPSFSLKKSCSGYVRAISRLITYDGESILNTSTSKLKLLRCLHFIVMGYSLSYKDKQFTNSTNLLTSRRSSEIFRIFALFWRVMCRAEELPCYSSEMVRDALAHKLLIKEIKYTFIKLKCHKHYTYACWWQSYEKKKNK